MKTTSKRAVLLFFTLLLSIFVNRATFAQVTLATGEYPPYTSEFAPGGGNTTKIIRHVFAQINKTVAVSYLPWKRGYELTAQGDFTAAFPYLKNEKREELFYFSDPVVVWNSRVFTKNGSDIIYKKPEDIYGKTECLPHHYAGLPVFDEIFNNGRTSRERPPNIESCWKMLLYNRVDFFIEDELVAEIYKMKTGANYDKIFVASDEVVAKDYGYMIFPKSDPDSLKRLELFNRTLLSMYEDGTINDIR